MSNDWAKHHNEAWENFGRLSNDDQNRHIISQKVDPTYMEVSFGQMANYDPVLKYSVPFVAVYRWMRKRSAQRRAKKEVPFAIEDGFEATFEEGLEFHLRTRWNENIEKCLALELMLYESDRVTHFAAWKVSKIDKKHVRGLRIGGYIERFNTAYRKKFFPGGTTYRDG